MAELGRPWALATGYDIAFLHLVMVTLEESPVERLSCTAVPFRKLPVRRLSESARRWLTAVNILLIEAKCRDDISDEKAWKGKLGLKLVQKQADTAREVLLESGFPLEQLTTLPERQAALERDSLTLEEYAIPTSLMLGEVFAHSALMVKKPEMATPLRQLGQGLGCAVYIKDSLDDLKADQKRGRFNALHSSSSCTGYGRTALSREVRRAGSGLARLGFKGSEAGEILNQLVPPPPAVRGLPKRGSGGFCELLLCCDLAVCCDAGVCCSGGEALQVCACCPCDACCAGCGTTNQSSTKSNSLEVPVSSPPVSLLHCPACGADLAPYGMGSFDIDECRQCHGMWLDHGELEKLSKMKRLPGRFLTEKRTLTRQLRPEGTRPCPRCSKLLIGTTVQGVRLDLCDECQGLWLDQGELNQILK